MSFDKFKVFLVSTIISCCLMAFLADLKCHQHRRSCFWSRKHHLRILALTLRLAGLALHVPFWLLLISQLRRCQWRSQWFVPICIHSVSQSHLLAILTRLLSGFAHVLFDHFDLWFHCWRYSRVHLFQIMSAYAWAILNDFLSLCLLSLDGMNGALALSRPSKKWLVVSAVKSSGLSLTAVRGLALSVCSTRQIVVLSTPSVKLLLSKIAIMTFL